MAIFPADSKRKKNRSGLRNALAMLGVAFSYVVFLEFVPVWAWRPGGNVVRVNYQEWMRGDVDIPVLPWIFAGLGIAACLILIIVADISLAR